jgi:3'-phosphoadenosine 5'-phosphosulfate (PAPS) 3'-phosphatase
MEAARRAVEVAAAASLVHRRTDLRIERKPDGSPVTSGDLAADAAIFLHDPVPAISGRRT